MSDPVREALAELVALDDLRQKYSRGVPDSPRDSRWDEYQRDVANLGSRHRAAWAAARAALAQPAQCHDNDSPWLVCKPCAAAGKCAKAPQPAEPVAGWRMVPVDPTDAMVDATHHGQPVADIYRDMIAAAPPAPPQPELAALRAERDALLDKVRRLVAMTEQPNPDDPQRYYIKPGEGRSFSNLVGACVALAASAGGGNV